MPGYRQSALGYRHAGCLQLSMGDNATGTWGSQVERRRRENRGTVGCYTGRRTTPAGQILRVATHATPAALTPMQLSHVRTADPSADGRRSAASRTAIGGGISSRRPRGDNLFQLYFAHEHYITRNYHDAVGV